MVFLCNYVKTLFRDEKTGYTKFAVTTKAEDIPLNQFGNVVCEGIIQLYPVNMPLEIEGTLTKSCNRECIHVTKCIEKTGGAAATISFLSSRSFNGIGEKTARAIVDTYGDDIFALAKEEKVVEKLTEIKGMDEKTAINLVSRINNMSAFRELIEYITSLGGTYQNALDIYEMYNLDAMNKMQTNPYLLRYAGVPFYICEAIAKKNHINALDKKRLVGLIDECFRLNEGAGNIYFTMHSLCEMVAYLEKHSNMHYHTNPFFIAATLVEYNKKYFIKTEHDEVHIYKKELFELEKTAAEHMVRLMNHKKDFPIDICSLDDIEKECGVSYAVKQREAFDLLEDNEICILTGGPGTGKTTTLNGILRMYEKMFPDNKIALCAPTGNAAKRMRDATGRHAYTVHKLLDVRPYGDDIKCFDEFNPLPYDLIVVDEFSMVDIHLFVMLLKAIKNGAKLMLVGDADQLASVGVGNVLYDIMHSGYVRVCQLDTVFRQEFGSAIVSNAEKIKKGLTNLEEDATFVIHRVSSEEQLKHDAILAMKRFYDVDDQMKVRMYSPVRNKKYDYSTTNINRMMHENYNCSKYYDALTYGGNTFSANDPIIMTANNYKLGYFNGDEGYVHEIIQGEGRQKQMVVCIDECLITLKGKDLDDVELAYAITTYKAQGGECETAIIVVPEKPYSMLERSLIYVAGTRAKKRNIFIVQNDALEQAIKNEKKHKRKTGLLYRLEDVRGLAV